MLRLGLVCPKCSIRLSQGVIRPFLRHQSTDAITLRSELLTPKLLERARYISGEHAKLSTQLSDRYDARIAKKLGETATVAGAMKKLDIETESLAELQNILSDPSTDAELRELAQQDLESSTIKLNEAVETLVKSLIPKHPFADLPCVIEVRPGVGGQEASLFARELLNMYNEYSLQNRLQPDIIKADDEGDDTHGLTEGILEVSAPGSYGLLRGEAGVHRVQRIPATEVKGRVHTSTASVMVLPWFSRENEDVVDINDPASDFYIDAKEVRKEYMRSSGAGGQHVNKTESAVRLVFEPMNIVVSCQTQRNRNQNEDQAWRLLRARVAQMRREAREEQTRDLRRSVVGVAKIGRSDKIRTYNFQQQRVTDHRSGLTVHGIDGIMEGGVNLDKIMQSVRKWLGQTELEDLIAVTNADSKESKS